ncbi:hypothetical protein TRFO_25617 [Tritrichomonas foetus]|uniref:Uncharacterized protein n=1 Tax=Tritrichomonas foetus TaxID=1144522 RepID=A0A1J4K9C5_9EUKA|nr:hypothetical protein TRFO_25617 [Tritrichomonas foetus]|eukprot:OHT06292.1 hypothetical protein TRFO_25617 [Tritrichomonas foetus]
MSRRAQITDPKLAATEKRRFERMRARKQFGKEFLSEIKQCVQKTDYLVKPPTPVRKRTRQTEKEKVTKESEALLPDENYPHVKFVIQPRIRAQKVPKFMNTPRSHKTMAPDIEDAEYAKRSEGRLGDRSFSSSGMPRDRYNLSALSANRMSSSESDSSNAENYSSSRNSNKNQNNTNNHNIGSQNKNNSSSNSNNNLHNLRNIKNMKNIKSINKNNPRETYSLPNTKNDSKNSSDSFDDATHFASLNLNKKKTKFESSDSSDSNSLENIPKKPTWKFSDDGRLGKSSGFGTSNDFRWRNENQISKISSSSDSEQIDIEKIKKEAEKEKNYETDDLKPNGNDKIFFSDSHDDEKIEILPKSDKLQHNDDFEKEKENLSSVNSQKPLFGPSAEDMERNVLDSKAGESPIRLLTMIPPDLNSHDHQNQETPNKMYKNSSNHYNFPDDSDDQIEFNDPTLQTDSSSPPPPNDINENENEEEEEIEKHRKGIPPSSSTEIINKEIEKTILNSTDSTKKFLDCLSDDDLVNDIKSKRQNQSSSNSNNTINSNNENKGLSESEKNENKNEHNSLDSSSSSYHKEDDIPVSLECDVDHNFIFSTSTSEAMVMKTPIINDEDDADESSSSAFGNGQNFFETGTDSSSSEAYEVSAVTDTREKEIRENRKLDRLIYSGDPK